MTLRKARINGRRGVFQLMFALTYLAVGLSYVTDPDTDTRAEALGWVSAIVPIHWLAFVWVFSAGIGAFSAFNSRPRDWVGFAALTAAPICWGTLFFIGFLTGSDGAWAYAMIYWLFGAAPMIVAGMQGEHDRDRRRVPA